MKKHYIMALGLGVLAIGLMWILSSNSKQKDAPVQTPIKQDKIKITASFYSLAHFAEQVGGDKVEVVNLTPAGGEPHDFEPTPKDLIRLYSSDLVIINGAGLEPWVVKILPELQKKRIKVLDASAKVNLLKIEYENGEGSHEEHDHGDFDPHFWLDPIVARYLVGDIRDILVTLKPEFTDEFNNRSEILKSNLAELDAAYKSGLADCRSREIIVSHDAYNYLAKRYKITLHPISGLSPEEEPSAFRIRELSNLAKSKNIKYVFFETLVSPALAETVAREIGAQTLVLNPLEGLTIEEIAQGKNYVSVMKDNLTNLRTAMQCQ